MLALDRSEEPEGLWRVPRTGRTMLAQRFVYEWCHPWLRNAPHFIGMIPDEPSLN
jgi:hypothetical protein